MALLLGDGKELIVIDDPIAWARQNDPTPRSPQVEASQAQLAALGFAQGFVDGLPGPKTRQAIEEFQALAGLPRSGVFDARTEEAVASALVEFSPDYPCETLSKEERCPQSGPLLTAGASLNACPSERGAELPVQVDYSRPPEDEGEGPQYVCSAAHSCLFLSRISPQSYVSVCAQK